MGVHAFIRNWWCFNTTASRHSLLQMQFYIHHCLTSLPASLHIHVVVFQKTSTLKKRVGQCEPGEDWPVELCWMIFLDNHSLLVWKCICQLRWVGGGRPDLQIDGAWGPALLFGDGFAAKTAGTCPKFRQGIFFIFRSCAPEVWHLPPKSKMAGSFVHFASKVSKAKPVGCVSNVTCINTKKNGWKTIPTAKKAAYWCKFISLQQSTVHHISARSPTSHGVMNELNKPSHSLHPQQNSW